MSVTVHFQLADDGQEALEVMLGQSIRDAAVSAGVPGIDGECGGQLNCATCHVYVDDEFADLLPEIGDLEDAMLDDTACPREKSSRLSCQIRAISELAGCRFRIPESQY